MLHALLVEDNVDNLDFLEQIVHGLGFETTSAQTLSQARELLGERRPDLAVLDLDLPDGNGQDLFSDLNERCNTEVIVVTGNGSIDSAVSALRQGVRDYFTKPLDVDRFDRVLKLLRQSLDQRHEGGAAVALPTPKSRSQRNKAIREGFDRLIGRSPAMQALCDDIARVARTEVTVLLTGETGTGKELVAETIHGLGPRADGPLVAVNCGALQPSLIESQLFGHEAGSFTGASRTRKGLFERARGGTLFLDEVGEMPLELQVNLLRVLETRRACRIGGESDYEVDVRLIAATNRSPAEAVREGQLRKDLFYRLNVFPIHVPPLRERLGDLDFLATHLLEEVTEGRKAFTSEALERLKQHGWPGNVRELRNVVERAAVVAEERVRPEHVRFDATEPSALPQSAAPGVGASIAEVERWLILSTLDHFDWSKKKAAETLGISLKTLYTRLNAYGVRRGQQRKS